MSVELSLAGEMQMAMRIWRHFEILREQGQQFDLCLKSSEGQDFHAHRILVEACMPNLQQEATPPSGLSEARGIRAIRLKTTPAPLLQSLLDFAYKGKVKVNQETLAPLAVLAQRVGLCELVDVCANAIINCLGALNISACLRVANTIQNETLSTGIADYVLTTKKLSAENVSLVNQLGENMMHEIIQFGPFTEKEKLLLLIAWFDNSTKENHSQVIFEAAVERLIDHIDCTGFDSLFIMGLLCKSGSNFSNNQACKQALHNRACKPVTKHISYLLCQSSDDSRLSRIIELSAKGNRMLEERTLTQIPFIKWSKMVRVANVIYLIGGYVNGSSINTLQSYDMTTQTWTTLPPMEEKRDCHEVCFQGDCIIVAGGKNTSEYHNTCEAFDTKSKSWSTLAKMTTKRGYFSLICLPTDEGGLIAIGGYNGDHIDVVECLTGDGAKKWRRLAPLPLPLSSRVGVYFKQRILVVGGQTKNFALTSTTLAFNPPTAGGLGQWVTLKPQLPCPEFPRHITVCGNSLFLANDSQTPVVYSFNPTRQASLEEKRDGKDVGNWEWKEVGKLYSVKEVHCGT